MSFCKRDADQEEPDSISDLDYFCWLGGSALMMVTMGVMAIYMATFSLWLTFQWCPNLFVTALVSVVGLPLWGGLSFLAWVRLMGRALMGMTRRSGSGILFLISPALAAAPAQALGLLSWWWGRDVMVADPLIVYCTALAVLLLVLPPTGIRWRGKEKTS